MLARSIIFTGTSKFFYLYVFVKLLIITQGATLYLQSLMHMSSHRHALALRTLELATRQQHSESYAMMSWLLQHGREGVPVQRELAHAIAAKGMSFGCEHCQGALANCVLNGWNVAKNAATALKMAKESAAKGSQFGQYVLAMASIVQPGHNAEETSSVVIRNLKLASDQGLPEARLSYATALITLFKDIEKEKGKIDEMGMRLYEQAAFCGNLYAQSLLGQIRVISRTEAAEDLETLAVHVKKNVPVDSRLKLMSSALSQHGPASSTSAPASSWSRQAAFMPKRASVSSNLVTTLNNMANSAIKRGSNVPAAAAADALAVQQEERKGTMCESGVGGHGWYSNEHTTAVPLVMQRLGKLLGTQYCPDCDQSATIGTKCAVSGSYHMV